MKKRLLLGGLMGALALPVAAQRPLVPAAALPADSLTHRITFRAVVPVPGLPAAELQARAREWVALTFQDARQVTQLDDAARGVLIVRGYTTTWVDAKARRPNATTPLGFTCRLDFRDGRYRYEITDLSQPVVLNPLYSNVTPVAGNQFYETSSALLGGTATLAASSRQALLQPDLAAYPELNDVAARFGRDWGPFANVVQQTMSLLMESLRRHETTPPPRW